MSITAAPSVKRSANVLPKSAGGFIDRLNPASHLGLFLVLFCLLLTFNYYSLSH